MKSHLFAALFFLSTPVFCQDWAVMNSNDKFHYRLDGDTGISLTISADSFQVNGSDTLYFLNRFMCDTCVTLIGGPDPCDTCYGLKNIPGFLQRTCRVLPGGVAWLQDTASLVIRTRADLNDPWTFDSTQSLMCMVIDIYEDTIFGTADSVKIIYLVTGDTLVLSKNFGVLQFPTYNVLQPYYRLVGIGGRNVGLREPGYSDFFNFDVGDMFEFKWSSSHIGGFCSGGWEQGCTRITKYTIISKAVSGDTLIYGIQGFIRDVCVDFSSVINPPFPSCTTYSQCNGGVWYIDSQEHWLNKFPSGQVIKLQDLITGPASGLPCLYNDSAYDKVKLYTNGSGRQAKYFGTIDTACFNNPFWCSYQFYNEINQGSDTLASAPQIAGGYSSIAITGLGIVHWAYSFCFEGGIGESLMAYRKGNDTVGVFTPDNSLSGIDDTPVAPAIQLYPNPSNENLFVEIASPIRAELSVLDLQGKKLLAEELKDDKTVIDISALSNGIYILSIQTKDWIATRKFCKLLE